MKEGDQTSQQKSRSLFQEADDLLRLKNKKSLETSGAIS